MRAASRADKIDTVLPKQRFATEGRGYDREDCMKQFKAVWKVFASDPERLAAFIEGKAAAKRYGPGTNSPPVP